MKTRLFFLSLLFVGLQTITFGQSTDQAKLIQGMWYYDSPDPESRGTLNFSEDGDFVMAWYSKTEDAKVSKGKYEVEDGKVIFTFENGKKRTDVIEVLDDENLKLVYIETISKYTRPAKVNK